MTCHRHECSGVGRGRSKGGIGGMYERGSWVGRGWIASSEAAFARTYGER